VSQAKAEAIELALGPDIPGGANAFDRLELDLELKGDVVLKMDVTFNARVVTYYLEAGAGRAPIVPDPSTVTRCTISSDAGPDSGPSDNCRWVVDELGKSFRITPLQGEFSLEGGGDFVDASVNRTAIFLTEADGIFDCGDTATSADAAMSCAVTRLDPGGTAACVPVPYVFRTGGGTCELTVDPNGQQIVANLFVSYDPEPAPGNLLTIGSAYSNWPEVPLSRVWFANDPSNTSYPIPPCLGATISDGFTGPSPIPEIQNGDSTDWVPGNDTIEFACAFQRTETLETDPGSNSLKRYVEEGIQFWGDIKFERF